MRHPKGYVIHHIIFRLYLYFLNIVLYFFKYSCTNIFHRCSLYTFYSLIIFINVNLKINMRNIIVIITVKNITLIICIHPMISSDFFFLSNPLMSLSHRPAITQSSNDDSISLICTCTHRWNFLCQYQYLHAFHALHKSGTWCVKSWMVATLQTLS